MGSNWLTTAFKALIIKLYRVLDEHAVVIGLILLSLTKIAITEVECGFTTTNPREIRSALSTDRPRLLERAPEKVRLQKVLAQEKEIGPKPLWNATYTDKLRQDLLLNYDKFARPASYQNSTTVNFSVTIRHVELNEFKSTLTVYALTVLTWMDIKLKWNETEYGGMKKIHMAAHEIWQPDIFLYNSGVSTAITQYNAYSIVKDSGEVLWVPSNQFTVFCNLNLKYWPFDTQTCDLVFGSWSHHGDEIDLQLYDRAVRPTIQLDPIIESTEFTIVKTSIARKEKYYNCCAEAYPVITVTVTLTRNSPSYSALIITPALFIVGMILSGFNLPPQAGEKIILNGCTAIIVTLFLLYFTQKIPAMGTHTPLIVFFFSSCLSITALATIGSVLVIWISRTQHDKPLTWFIKQLLVGKFGRCLGMSNYIKEATNINNAEEMRDHQATDFEDNATDDRQFISFKNKTNYQGDWILLAVAIDRISFITYGLVCLILCFVYSI